MAKRLMLVVIIGLLAGVPSVSLGAPAGPVEITAAITLGINLDVARPVTDRFNASQNEVRVKIDAIPWTSIFEKMMIEFSTGRPSHDVLMHSMSMFPSLVRAGYLEPLDAYFERKDLVDKAAFDLKDFPESLMPRERGKLYHLPYMTGPQILFYREDLLRAAGLGVPSTTEEFMAAVKRLHNPQRGMYGTVLHGIRSGAGGNTYHFYPFLFSFGGNIVDAQGRTAIDSPEAIRALEYWLELGRNAPPDAINFGAGPASESMMAGNVALMVTYADHYARFLDPKRSKIASTIRWAPFPRGPVGRGIAVAHVWSVSISRYSRQKEAAFKYIAYLLSKQAMPEYVKAGGVPPRQSILTAPDAPPAFRLSAEGLKTARGVPLDHQYIRMEEILSVELSNALAGKKNAAQALRDAAAEIRRIRGR
ncbi:MAG: sugar ABC transporter substrate-binding protein [Armatimonadetes bacterium]|nr:sugar ABC transporter substrate-binding protein [Armatimonadota bacterium]